MLSTTRSVFTIKYYSPLGIKLCSERLTQEYKAQLIENGEIRETKYGWKLDMVCHKRGGIKVYSSSSLGGSMSPEFIFNVTLSEHDDGTCISLTRNLLRPYSLGLFGGAALAFLCGSVFSIVTGQMSLFATAFPFFIILTVLCIILEHCSRKNVTQYLEVYLDAKKVTK